MQAVRGTDEKGFALALITFAKGFAIVRSRASRFISLFLFGLNIAVAGFSCAMSAKSTVDMNLSALSVAGLLLVFFVGVNLMAKDIDRKTIHLVLSKPISRVEYIWGKYFGILLFILTSMAVLLVLSCLTMLLLKGMYADYFGQFSWGVFFIAAFFVFIKIAVVAAIIIFFSSITSNSFITLIFSLCTFIVGVSIEEVVFYLRSSFAAQEGVISESLQSVISVVSYVVPNFAAFDFKTEAAHGLLIGWQRLGFSLGYATVYVVILLLLASFIFRRREFN